ncbi:SWI/SNF complex component snf12 [Scheffersomyces spartinae]|uniref:SWI/SNF complex component snf12 n=1 Tax=Scheffersomyces spartinae TaxID=45513 RepID=A0A9P7VD48_9ASCO|nr:SWI/SNF complex component snf12 [Scheffersomyces spartinae]KAG7195674.1 SWI/SNF complex component snf12 [Scheffersomyces spartinae]
MSGIIRVPPPHDGSAPHPPQVQAAPSNRPRANPSSHPAVSYTPTDITIPEYLYEKVPSLELYKRLKAAEKDLDLLISRDALDFQLIQQNSMHPSNLKPEKGLLRVFIYNTCENQPWQNQLLQEQGMPLPDPASSEASWTLRVEGRFVQDGNDVEDQLKFSSFLSGITIDLIPNEDYPNLTNTQGSIIEWRDPLQPMHQQQQQQQQQQHQKEFDGLDVKRLGIFNIKAKITLMLKNHSNSFSLTPKMAQFLSRTTANQQEVVYMIWRYIMYNDLFDQQQMYNKVPAIAEEMLANVNPEVETDVSTVICDDLLKDLLGVELFKIYELYKLTLAHLRPLQPLIIDYEVNTRKSTTLGEVVLDIPVELPISISKIQKEVVEFNKSAFENMARTDMTIQQINNRISLGIVALQNANLRERFYRELSNDPVTFVKNWVQTQLDTFRGLKSDEGYDEEVVRRADYFIENELLLKEKIDLLLGSTRL